MKRLLALGILAALAATSTSAQSVQITGFGQMVAGTVTDGNAFPGTGYDSDWDYKDESLFALQVRGDLNEQWSATAQIVARGRDDFDPEFAWAYVGWNGGNGWSAKAGRQRVPFFRYSDFLEVGYAYPWLRPPHAVYNATFSNYDGISAAYSFGSGDWFSNVGVVGGKNEGDLVISNLPATQELGSLVGIYADTTYADWLSLRASYLQADVSANAQALNPLLTALRGNGFANVAEALDFTEDPGSFIGLAAEVNKGNWLLIGEWTKTSIDDSYFYNRKQYYITGGYRFGAWMPNVTWGRRDNEADRSIIARLPNVAPLAPLRAAVSGVVLGEELDATYWSYGLRWDVATNVALKADYTQYTNDTPASADADSLAVGVVFTF
ncbi:hypothetical protein [Silanimonas sp.]|jgi:hypothetical protein|uniref:hypothetical protein n=1 Tax=Silanimonas sp. TaxID=1929290 RepID=UPI0022CA1D6D|nr:hypothetical protein [Silanimonas sp.]MCZ8114842.1 hypothetical protein [Silanimonas sp.]